MPPPPFNPICTYKRVTRHPSRLGHKAIHIGHNTTYRDGRGSHDDDSVLIVVGRVTDHRRLEGVSRWLMLLVVQAATGATSWSTATERVLTDHEDAARRLEHHHLPHPHAGLLLSSSSPSASSSSSFSSSSSSSWWWWERERVELTRTCEATACDFGRMTRNCCWCIRRLRLAMGDGHCCEWCRPLDVVWNEKDMCG